MAGSRTNQRRLDLLSEEVSRAKLDGAVLVPGPNLRYFTGADSILLERPFMLLVPAEGRPQLVAPELEAGPYKRSGLDIDVHSWTDSQGPQKSIAGAVAAAKVKGRWGVEGKVPFLFLSKLMKETRAKFFDAEGILQGMRETKDEDEVRVLKKSARILSEAFETFPSFVKEGVSELELGRKATEAIYEAGATMVDAMLVQSGPRAADPHGLPTPRKVKRGEGVLFDVGATFEGYYADITRVMCLGKAPELEKVYANVLEAEEAGIAAGKKGARVGSVDKAARDTLKSAGLGKYFIHRTGHGLGLEVHEAPYIVEGGKEALRDGMCYTVEPGAYIPGKLGVRIEDDVLIEGGKAVETTSTPKEFGWWT